MNWKPANEIKEDVRSGRMYLIRIRDTDEYALTISRYDYTEGMRFHWEDRFVCGYDEIDYICPITPPEEE